MAKHQHHPHQANRTTTTTRTTTTSQEEEEDDSKNPEGDHRASFLGLIMERNRPPTKLSSSSSSSPLSSSSSSLLAKKSKLPRACSPISLQDFDDHSIMTTMLKHRTRIRRNGRSAKHNSPLSSSSTYHSSHLFTSATASTKFTISSSSSSLLLLIVLLLLDPLWCHSFSVDAFDPHHHQHHQQHYQQQQQPQQNHLHGGGHFLNPVHNPSSTQPTNQQQQQQWNLNLNNNNLDKHSNYEQQQQKKHRVEHHHPFDMMNDNNHKNGNDHHHHHQQQQPPREFRDGQQPQPPPTPPNRSQQHPLLSIINFSTSTSTGPKSHSNANKMFVVSSPSSKTFQQTEQENLNGHHHVGPIIKNLANDGGGGGGDGQISNESSLSLTKVNDQAKISGHHQQQQSQQQSNEAKIRVGDSQHDIAAADGNKPFSNGDNNVQQQQQRTPRARDSKLGHDFLMAASNVGQGIGGNDAQQSAITPSLPTQMSARPNSKDLSRNLPHNPGDPVEKLTATGSSMNDLLGGLAQLLGGNLKLPTSGGNGVVQLPPFATGPEQQNKLATLLAQMTGGGNLGLNQRIPPHLTHLIPRGPSGTPMLPNFGMIPPAQHNSLPQGQQQPPKIQNVPARGAFPMPPVPPAQPHHHGLHGHHQPPSYQLPSFIPLMGSSTGNGGGNGRPPIIPLGNSQNQNSQRPNDSGGGGQMKPQMHGLTKAEMDALFHQFMAGNGGANKTQNLISNLMSKLSDPSKSSSNHHPQPPPPPLQPINNNDLVPFNLNDTSKRIQPSHIHHHGGGANNVHPTHTAQEPPPQIITMQEGPSVFEMVVKHKLGPSVQQEQQPGGGGGSKPSMHQMNIKPTSTFQPPVPSQRTSTTGVMVASSQPSLVQPSISQPEITEIRNHHTQVLKVTTAMVASASTANSKATTITVQASTTTPASVANHNDVVYGKRITASATMRPSQATTAAIEIHSSFGNHPHTNGKKFLQPTATSTMINSEPTDRLSSASIGSASSVSFGKPVVMQLPIENVKPKIGQYEPSSPLTPTIEGTRMVPSKGFIQDSKHGGVGGGPSMIKQSSQNQQQQLHVNTPTGQGNSSYSLSKSKSQAKPFVRRPSFRPRPNVPIVRIDTCIVGDDSTCDVTLNEKCITELGLSSCQCRPGFARTIPRTSCVPVISLAISFRVDKMANQKVQFTRALLNPNSEEYQYLEYESMHALNSMFAQTKSFPTDLMAVKINRFYAVGGRTVVNATISLRSNETNVNSQRIKRAIQQELMQVIIDNQNQLGESQLSVDSSSNAITRIDDLNECSSPEYNDCSKNAICINEFGGFRCECEPGYEDKYPDDRWQSGRHCSSCSPQYCSNRGECLIVKGEKVCRCRANFIGSQCDIDAEVLGVAIGGSIAALVIIVITFICLYMWNQRFRQEQAKIEAMSAASGHTFSYMFNKPNSVASQMATAHHTLSRMSMIDERYGAMNNGGGGGGNRSWSTIATTTNGGHSGYSDSHQHLLASTNNNNGGGYYNQAMANSDHQNASHVYAQPVRVVPAAAGGGHGSSDYDPSGYGGHHDVWGGNGRIRSSLHSKHKPQNTSQQSTRHGKTGTGTTTGTLSASAGIHYPYKHDTYNETEFSTRELIYSPAHLYATNPRQANHGYY